VIGLLQGVTELFPVSSLGHSVLIPAIIGGQWAADLSVTGSGSYLAFVVGLHVATAIALLVFFWRDWVRIIGGLFTSVRYRRVSTPEERLAWMIIIGTIPVGVAGLALDHTFRTLLGKPAPAAVFLMINGLILFAAERMRRRPARVVDPGGGAIYGHPRGPRSATAQAAADRASDVRISDHTFVDTTIIATAQVGALLAGISRSGITMAAGLFRGLSHEDAARFAFLLATPAIFAAGVFKAKDLLGPSGHGIHGQVFAGSVVAAIAAYVSVRFLTRYFETRTLKPFAIYCLIAGALSLLLVATHTTIL
jgi:undecaprenyl-diphosphatase